MKIWKGATFSKKIYDDFMIFSYDKIYDHKFPVTKCTISADRKTRKIVYPNETTRAYICYQKTISTQTVAERCKIYA